MATAASIKVVKSMTYRGGTKLWSNRYFLSDGAPADTAKWTTMSDSIVTAEKATLPSSQTIVGTYGYAAGSDVPVFSKTYTTAGTLTSTGIQLAPGDCAILVRYATGARTSKNHPLYLFNYVHGVLMHSTGIADQVHSSQVTAMNTYASNWITGFSDGVVQHHRCGPNGDLATGYLVSNQVHHRDFPRG